MEHFVRCGHKYSGTASLSTMNSSKQEQPPSCVYFTPLHTPSKVRAKNNSNQTVPHSQSSNDIAINLKPSEHHRLFQSSSNKHIAFSLYFQYDPVRLNYYSVLALFCPSLCAGLRDSSQRPKTFLQQNPLTLNSH